MENNEKKGIFSRLWNWFNNLTVKGLLGAILLAFIVIIFLMSVSYLPKIISRVSSSLSAALYSVFVPAEGATMIADKKIINSGEDFTVTFKTAELLDDSLFAVFYECDSAINLLAVESNGLKNIDCNKSYYLLNNSKSLKIRAITSDENVVRLALTGTLENNETLKSETVGVARVTVKNSGSGTLVTNTPVIPATTSPQTVTPPPVSNYNPPTYPTYYGKPDLAVRVLQVGILNRNNNSIISQTQFSTNDTVGIKFEVRNDGDANSGSWNFTATLPSISTPNYSAPTQISLRPGESIQFTLGFSGIVNQSSNLLTVRIDPSNIVSESNENNNILTSTITNTGYNNNYNYNNSNNGCYVNGFFTYNCDNNYNYYGNLSVSCYARPSNPETGESVRWYANVYGGSGDYDYDWSGTNSLNSSTKNPSKTYSTEGTKYATVTVKDDNGYSVTQTCSIYVDDDNSNNNNSSRSSAQNAIDDAEDAINDAEDEIDDSNSSSSRINRAEDFLDDARDMLDDAEEAFDDGDYDDAEDFAEEAEDLANEAIDEL